MNGGKRINILQPLASIADLRRVSSADLETGLQAGGGLSVLMFHIWDPETIFLFIIKLHR